MHLGANRSWVPLTNEALSMIIYVKVSRYSTLRRIKLCKRLLCLVLHRTRQTRICKLKTLWNTRLRCEKHRGKRVSVSGYRDRAGPGWGWGGFSPPTFLAVHVRTLNVQLEIFKVLMKDGEFTCFDDILAKIKQLSEAEKCMITEIMTLCKLLVNPATNAAGERSFSSARRLKTWLRSTMTQTRFSNLTILNTDKQRTDKLCLIDVANEFAALNENRKSNFGTFKGSDLKMSG